MGQEIYRQILVDPTPKFQKKIMTPFQSYASEYKKQEKQKERKMMGKEIMFTKPRTLARYIYKVCVCVSVYVCVAISSWSKTENSHIYMETH